MSELSERPFPRGALVGATTMVGLALSLVLFVRITGADISSMPPASPVVSRDLRFVDDPDGGVAVYDAREKAPIQVLPPGTNGFVRAMMRNFARERRSNGIGPEAPFRLGATRDGRLVLQDPTTGRHVDLEAFGQTNAGVFAAFLTDRP